MLFPDQNRHVRYLIGLYLKRRRHDLRLPSQTVARTCGLTPQSYSRIESGRAKIATHYFDILTELLRLDDEELLEIRRISCVMQVNELSRALSGNYPQ